jgi:FtsZ-binding cell division protein ZapB
MARNDDHAPIGHTCPMIDEVISYISSIDFDLNDESEVLLNDGGIDAVKTLEKIREANSTLRSWGNEMCKESMDYERERDDLEKENKNLKHDNDYYQKEVQSLESKVSELEDKIYELEKQTQSV